MENGGWGGGWGVDTKRKLSVEGKIHSVYNNTKDG